MLAYIVIFGLLLLALAWFFLGGRGGSHEPTAHRTVGDDVDRTELERAEREVQDAADADSVQDWGPGAGRPRPPDLL